MKKIAIGAAVGAVTIIVMLAAYIAILSEAPYKAINIEGRINTSLGVQKSAEFDITGGVEILGLKTPDNVEISPDGNTINIRYENEDEYIGSGGDVDWKPSDKSLKTAEVIFSALKREGVSDAAAAGILGNIQAESSMDSSRLQGKGGHAKGLAQWEGGRFDNLVEFAKKEGTEWTDLNTQVKFLVKELKSESTWKSFLMNCEGAAEVNRCTKYKSNLSHNGYTPERFCSETNPEKAAIIYCCHFERPSTPAMANRIMYAKAYYSIFSNGEAGIDADITGTIDRKTLVDAVDGKKGYKVRFRGTINGWPVDTEGYALETNVAQSGGQGSYIDINTYGHWGVETKSRVGDGTLVGTALTQLGNDGGQPYWSWYGFPSRVEWCATFVSWCAEQNGFIEAGIIPKFASCDVGMEWFKNHNQWADGGYEPVADDIIFFNWDGNRGSNDAQHVGIVKECVDGVVYTVEGNCGDRVAEMNYPIDSPYILGYGLPKY